MNKLIIATTAALLATTSFGSTASATVIIKTLKLDATGFSDGTPDASVIFKINFDNSSNFSGNFSGVTSIFSNTWGPLQIGYDASTDFLSLVGGVGTANSTGCNQSAESFCSFIYGISDATPSSNFFLNFDSGVSFASSVSLTEVSAVPEPATWAFMILGFGAIGGALRRRRNDNVNVSYA